MGDVDAYWEHMETVEYPVDHIYYPAIDIFGEFNLYSSPPPESEYFGMHYFYLVADANGVVLNISIQRFEFDSDIEADILTELPSGMESMRDLPSDLFGDSSYINYSMDGLTYQYRAGRLRWITWYEDGLYYSVSSNFPPTFQYPETGEETIFMRLLSVDDGVAMDAWKELKTHIRDNSKKPIDWKSVMIGTGAVVLVVGIGVTTWVVVHKKRKKAAAEQSVAIPEPISEE
jgi:hypothetical protein